MTESPSTGSSRSRTSSTGNDARPTRKVNEAYERLLRSDVKYRFAIDIASPKSG